MNTKTKMFATIFMIVITSSMFITPAMAVQPNVSAKKELTKEQIAALQQAKALIEQAIALIDQAKAAQETQSNPSLVIIRAILVAIIAVITAIYSSAPGN